MKKRSATRENNDAVVAPRTHKSIEHNRETYLADPNAAYGGVDYASDTAANARISRSGIERYRPNSRHGPKDITRQAKGIYATPQPKITKFVSKKSDPGEYFNEGPPQPILRSHATSNSAKAK